eukprot:971228-Lingulodinium_polyedra.AAC.1
MGPLKQRGNARWAAPMACGLRPARPSAGASYRAGYTGVSDSVGLGPRGAPGAPGGGLSPSRPRQAPFGAFAQALDEAQAECER